MARQGANAQPEFKESETDDECDATVIDSDTDTDGTEIDSDKQSDEEWEDGEDNKDKKKKQATQGTSQETKDRRRALNIDLLRENIKQPKILQHQLTEFELDYLGVMMNTYKQDVKGTLVDRKTFVQPLHCISIMAHLAEKRKIWGPFVVVAPIPMLHKWQYEISKLVPSFTVLPYCATAGNRQNLKRFWSRRHNAYTQDPPFHVLVTSYQWVLSDAANFQEIQWQYIVLDESRIIQRTELLTLQNLLGFHRPPVSYHESTRPGTDQLVIDRTAENPLDIRVVRKSKARSSRRDHTRADGLKHLILAQAALGGDESNEMQPLHGLAFCLIRLNISVLVVRDFAHQNNDFVLFSIDESSHMNGLVTGDEYKRWYLNPGAPIDSAQETLLAEYINTFSTEQAIQRIRDRKALPYLSKLFEHRLSQCVTWKTLRRIAENEPDLTAPLDHREMQKSEYANLCVSSHRRARWLLRELYNITSQLRRYATAAASSNLLDDISLRQLKAKMTALQPGFQEVCDELGSPKENLVWNSQTWWRDPQDTELGHRFLDFQPKNVVAAFPPTSNKNTNSALTFLVPVLSFLSCIPTALAWTHSPHQLGTISDADFFQLIANTSMQLLGNLTLIIPTISHGRLVGQAWFWTWMLAGTSTVCAILAIPLYLNAPTEWSAAVSFAGNVMQAFVTLQLMFAI